MGQVILYGLSGASRAYTVLNYFCIYEGCVSISAIQMEARRLRMRNPSIEHVYAIKSSGEMVRKEIEIPISREHFYALAEMVVQPFITKDFRIYQLPNDLLLECSHVDKGRNTEFMYAEVEFPSVEAAESFEPLSCFTEDVTNNPSYKMKNFWRGTRCATFGEAIARASFETGS